MAEGPREACTFTQHVDSKYVNEVDGARGICMLVFLADNAGSLGSSSCCSAADTYALLEQPRHIPTASNTTCLGNDLSMISCAVIRKSIRERLYLLYPFGLNICRTPRVRDTC